MTALVLLSALAFGAPTAQELLDATDDLFRGESSTATMEMAVKTSRYERTMKMRTWARGTDKSLIVIDEPAKDKGMATLKVDDNIWNYMPKVDRTMKVPAGMMSGAWMGSHFSNDDLVKENRLSEQYTWTTPTQNAGGNWVVVLTPKPDAPVVWGSLEVEVTDDRVPVAVRYKDEDGELARTMTWEEPKEMAGRTLPSVMRLVPADKPDEYTVVRYLDLSFDADVPESMFTLQSLKK
ncbi:MAG: outer membrane lipoprotein-sorting protein [Myxococcota bacterium]|jgi:outer membrane lipoprotein-sorting protein